MGLNREAGGILSAVILNNLKNDNLFYGDKDTI